MIQRDDQLTHTATAEYMCGCVHMNITHKLFAGVLSDWHVAQALIVLSSLTEVI